MRSVLVRFAVASSAAVIVIGLAVLADLRRELAGGYQSDLFYGELYGDFLDDYEGISVVAHNSGNSPETAAEALAAGAPIIEIDVRSDNGRLLASHSTPAPFVGELLRRPVSLAVAWFAARDAPSVKLDLKESSPAFLTLLFDFLAERRDPERQVIISSRSEAALRSAREEAPSALRLLSISTATGLADLRIAEERIDVIDGVSVRLGALTEDDVVWLHEQGLLVYTWVVNDLQDLNDVASWGVDAVTTDNLAIVELLSPRREDDLADEGEAQVRVR